MSQCERFAWLPWAMVWTSAVLLACEAKPAKGDDRTIVEASVQVNLAASGGSGVAIHDHIIATNSHVVEHRHRNDLTVVDVHGRQYSAQTIAIDRAADVALLWCKGRRWPFVRLAAQRPVLGAPLRLFGYGPQRQLRWGRGRVVETWQRNGVDVVDCSVSSVPGDSGGGLFDDAGQLVALNWGGHSESHYSTSTPAEYVRQVAERWVMEALPQDRWQEYACLGGRCNGGPGENAGSARGVAPPKWPVAPPPLDYHPPAQAPSVLPPVSQSPPVVSPPASIVSASPPAVAPVQQIDPEQFVARIVDKLAADDRFRGPAGPAGPAGKHGEPGKPGPKGEDAIVSRPLIQQIVAEELAKKMPEIVAQSAESVRGSVRVRVQPVKQ